MKRMNIMKFLRVGGIALAVGYFSMFSGLAYGLAGTIKGSVHDFSDGKYSDNTDFSGTWSTGGEICVVCHTPHGADTSVGSAPLWNHQVTAPAAFTLYDITVSESFDGTTTDPDGVSLLCLSCHDGSVAIDSYGTAGTTTTTIDAVAAITGQNLNIGENGAGTVNLSNDHPISFVYTEDTDDAGMFSSTVADAVTIGNATRDKTGSIAQVMLTSSGTVECTSCHDVHNNYVSDEDYKLLKLPMNGVTTANGESQLCLTCHNK